MLQEHCAGDEVKFYAVRGGRLFWPYYPKDSEGYPFDEKPLEDDRRTCRAKRLSIGIYGGDAIISPEVKITLIDLNDWPSFAPCRGAAASAIARYLKDTYATQNRRKTVPHRLKSPRLARTEVRRALRRRAGLYRAWYPDHRAELQTHD